MKRAPPSLPARLLAPLLTALVLAGAAAPSHAAPKKLCGQIANSFGPFDYNDPGNVQNIAMVEPHHFPEEVELGIRGATGPLGSDIDYTLRAIPNHPRALATMARVGVRDKVTQLPGAQFPVECYFVRAMEFQPADPAVRATYATYLMALGKLEMARDQLREAVALAPEHPTYNYNLGLAYYKTKQFKEANEHAHKAYALGFPLPGLKHLLVTAGKWQEPAP
jgi:tetratricopeptide (TPR) repeat protein